MELICLPNITNQKTRLYFLENFPLREKLGTKSLFLIFQNWFSSSYLAISLNPLD